MFIWYTLGFHHLWQERDVSIRMSGIGFEGSRELTCSKLGRMKKEEEKKEKTKFESMLRFLCGVKAWQNVCPLVKHKATKYQLH